MMAIRPTCVGMNRIWRYNEYGYNHPPHVRGDEPYNTGKLGKTNPESAPHAWG